MSHRLKARPPQGHPPPHQAQGTRPAHGGALGGRRVRPADFTLGHGGRQLRIGPIAFWTTMAAVAAMTAWSAMTATYFAFRDDLLTRLIARQAEMQYGYEDRIAELRGQVDRMASRQLLDQEQYEQKLDLVIRRQATLETRAGILAGVADPTPTGSIKLAPRAGAASAQPPTLPGKPSPISDTVILVPPPDREAALESRALPLPGGRADDDAKGTGIEVALARLQGSLERVEAGQAAALNTLEDRFDTKARRIRNILVDLGLDLGNVPVLGKAAQGPMGGPFVPIKSASEGSAFERQLYRINAARGQVEQLTRTLVAVPIRKPVDGEIDTTSGFGMRLDPFLHTPAMHTGLDFRGELGDPVRATAAGTVTTAGWSGGYGRMVEIDHGNGFATRYGHLSAIDVEVGQTIRIGQIVGRLGSTGRSTGPHLHYETRVEGDAVDPQRFLRAGIRLGEPL